MVTVSTLLSKWRMMAGGDATCNGTPADKVFPHDNYGNMSG